MFNEKLTFKNGKFRIMQIADTQESVKVNPDTVKLITLAIRKAKPDLIVFTGDQIHGLLPEYRSGDTVGKIKNTLRELLSPIEEAGVPFAVTFGNHDCQCGVSNARQAEIYAESPHYVGGEYRSAEDKGTYFVPLYNENGEKIFHVCLFDSNGQSPTGEYMPVKEEQLAWYESECEKEKNELGKLLPRLVFQHIPVPEYYDVIRRAKFGTRGAVEAFRVRKHQYYVLPESIKANGGFMLESPAVPDRNSGEFRVLKETGSVLGISVGHDHNNSFVAEKDGIKLIYTQGTGFNVYGPHLQRGVRLFDLDENDLSSFVTTTLTYGELCSDKLTRPVKEFVLTHIPTSIEQVKRLAIIAAGLGAITLTTAYYLYKNSEK